MTEVEIEFKAPRILGSTRGFMITMPLNYPPVKLFFQPKYHDVLHGLAYQGHIPKRPLSRIWIINEGKADLFYDIASPLDAPNDMFLTSLLRGGGETNGVSEGREHKTPENTQIALFMQARATDKNPTPTPANAFVRVETTT